MEDQIIFTEDEKELLEKTKKLYMTNKTPNHRSDNKSVIEIAIEGANRFSSFPLKRNNQN